MKKNVIQRRIRLSTQNCSLWQLGQSIGKTAPNTCVVVKPQPKMTNIAAPSRCHAPSPRRPCAAAPDLLDTSLCSISVREKGQSWQRRTHSPRVTSSPVSYTHLRAHETRHDLVCRLLLE